MEVPGNGPLAVHLPVSAICVIEDKVVNRRNDWVDKCCTFKRQHIDIFQEFKKKFSILEKIFSEWVKFFPQTLSS